MTDIETRIAAVLSQAGQTHHTVYRRFDGADDDWSSWYADWLTNLSGLPELLGRTVVRGELCWLLVQADRDHRASGSTEPWERFYARRIATHLATNA
jgi:hypothetical protein